MLSKKQLIVIPILLVLLCIIFNPVIFQGKIFSSPDSLNPKAAAIILSDTQKETGEYPLWQPWIFSGMPTAESFTLIRGDNYDGVANAALVFTPSKDMTAATETNFTIRLVSDDSILIDQDTAGVSIVTTATEVTVTLLNSATALLDIGEHKFDVEVLFTASHYTVARGFCTILQDQSRS